MDGSMIFTRWPQCALPCGRIGATWWIRLNLCFLWPTRVHNPNCKFIGSAVFTQLTAECHRVHLRHLANTIELVLPSARPSPQPNIKLIGSAISAQPMAESPYALQWATPPKLPFSWGYWTHLIHDSLCHSEPAIQTASRLVEPFSHRWPQCPYTLQWAPLSPETGIPSNTGFHGPIRVHN